MAKGNYFSCVPCRHRITTQLQIGSNETTVYFSLFDLLEERDRRGNFDSIRQWEEELQANVIRSLNSRPSACVLSLSLEAGCEKRIDASKFLLTTPSF